MGPEAHVSASRRIAAFATALVLAAGAWAASASAAQEPAKEKAPACENVPGLAVLASPSAPWKGAPLRVVFTAEENLDGELSLVAPDGKVAAASRERHGGPPYFWFAEVASPAVGAWQAKLVREGAGACATVAREIAVRKAA